MKMKLDPRCSMLATALAAFTQLSTLNPQLSTAFAQGTAFTYQGRLNVNGAPASGSYDFRYRLAVDPYGNNYFGPTLLPSGQAISNGLFLATLDFGAGAFNGSNYWLEIAVRTNGAGAYTTLNPLQPGDACALRDFLRHCQQCAQCHGCGDGQRGWAERRQHGLHPGQRRDLAKDRRWTGGEKPESGGEHVV
jgi:hypothetical protein